MLYPKTCIVFGFVSLAILAGLTSCRTRAFNSENSDSSEKSLRGMVVSKSTMVGELPFAKKNGIASKVFKEVVAPELEEENRNYRLRVEFGKLRKDQYDLLMNRFGGEGLVTFDANRNYELVDFLTPKIQALDGRWLLTVTEPDSRIPIQWNDPKLVLSGNREPVEVSVGFNCWMVLYEILRDIKKPFAERKMTFSFFGSAIAGPMFTAGATFSDVGKIKKPEWQPKANAAARNANRAVGDVLAIHSQFNFNAPAHLAMWIDDDIYFEKTNFSSEDPMRLALFNDVVSPYLEQDDESQPLRMEFLRLGPTAKPLPSPESLAGVYPFGDGGIDGIKLPKLPPEVQKTVIFSLDTSLGGNLGAYSVSRIVSVPLQRDAKTGRATAVGADKLSTFSRSDSLCVSSSNDRGVTKNIAFKYKIDRGLNLFVLNKRSGVEAARIKGQFMKGTGNGDVVMQFATGNKVLKLSMGRFGSTTLVHPGVSDEIEMSCIRDAKYFDKVD